MSPRDNLHQLVDRIPEDRLAEFERMAISFLRDEPGRGPAVSFEEAMAYTFENFDETFKRLAQ